MSNLISFSTGQPIEKTTVIDKQSLISVKAVKVIKSKDTVTLSTAEFNALQRSLDVLIDAYASSLRVSNSYRDTINRLQEAKI